MDKIKLQVVVPEQPWSDVGQELTDAYRESLPEDQRARAPRSCNGLIPLAMLTLLETLKPGLVTQERLDEARAIAHRRPGPKPKGERENLELFEDKPGAWVSCVDLKSGTSSAQVGDQRLSLFGCRCEATASVKAVEEGWGVVPEARDGLPGLRFIPPGSGYTVAAPEPMAPADVGVWVSEATIAKTHLLITTDGRVVKQRSDEEREAMFRCGTQPDRSVAIRRSSYLGEVAHDAFEAGWTARSEHRGGHPGILLIPPHVSLTYEVAPGRRVAVSQG